MTVHTVHLLIFEVNLTKLEALHAIWIYVVCLSAANTGGTD